MEPVETLTVQQVAEILGKSSLLIRCGIVQGTMPIGAAVKGEGRDSFIIPKKRFEKWVAGDDMGRMIEIDAVKVNNYELKRLKESFLDLLF